MSEYLFAYGTLRLARSHPMATYLAENSVLVGLAEVSKAKLYKIDWYPALVETNDEKDKVYGDVFDVNNLGILHQLDEYEDVNTPPYEYRRIKIKVKTELRELDAWTYLYNIKLPPHAELISSGDFLNP
jgi:gamma-glutamylcyclotransferase (GGCT)/AIG2-like uncharacterized protein YtfP